MYSVAMRIIPCVILPVAAFVAVGCSTLPREATDSAMSDIALWQRAVFDGVPDELVCRGMKPEAANAWHIAKFRERDRRVAEAMKARYGDIELEDIILTGRPCPWYRGAIRNHEQHLRMLEARLGLLPR
jgi:hypothetical protein